jgi:ABC-type transporter Mla subunit MlaD
MSVRNSLLFIASVMLFVAGCSEEGLTFKVRFPEINGLRADDPVVHEQNKIGKVIEITYTKEGDYLVQVVIAKEFIHATTSNSRFFIGRNPQDETKKTVEVVNSIKGGEPLAKGVTVEGSSRTAAALDQFLGSMKDTLKDLQGTLDEMTEPLRKFPDSDEMKRLREQMNDLMEALKQGGAEAHERFEKEILPELQKKMDELRERLKKFGREKEMDPLEKEMKDLKRI